MFDNKLAGLDSGELLQTLIGVPAEDLEKSIEGGGRVVVVLVQSSRGIFDNVSVSWGMLVTTPRYIEQASYAAAGSEAAEQTVARPWQWFYSNEM